MKILVTGSNGLLGYDIVRQLLQLGHDVISCGRKEMDIEVFDECSKVIEQHLPEIIIHCAAYTAVDNAESHIDQAYQINTVGTMNIAICAKKIKAILVYISTDYVFDGEKQEPYHEFDKPNPVSIYGKTKRAGELIVENLTKSFFIVRTSWVYGLHGNNFVNTMLRLGQEQTNLKVVNDQTGSPTFTCDLAEFISKLIETNNFGIYHASNTGSCTWYQFALAIFEEAYQLGIEIKPYVQPCATTDFLRPALRPKNSRLEHLAILKNGFNEFRPWREALVDFLRQWKQAN